MNELNLSEFPCCFPDPCITLQWGHFAAVLAPLSRKICMLCGDLSPVASKALAWRLEAENWTRHIEMLCIHVGNY